MKKTFLASFIGGMTTGMGNGSVFGATLMCFLGRGQFELWGGVGASAYNPAQFTGFIDWCMIIFGLAFTGIMMIALKRHDQLEAKKAR